MALRILTDTALITSGAWVDIAPPNILGFKTEVNDLQPGKQYLTYSFLKRYYDSTPGLVSDKLKHTLEYVWSVLKQYEGIQGIVFAYDEAQTLSDQSKERQYPLGPYSCPQVSC